MIRTLFAILITFFIANPSRAQEVGSKTYRKMLNTLLDRDVPEVFVNNVETEGTVFLDARELNEYNVSRMDKAQWVGYNDFTLDRVSDLPKDSKVVVYCSVGYRSEKVAEKLIDAGFTNVSNLYGGIFEWVNQEHPVVDSLAQPTDNVHAYDRIWGLWLKKGNKVYN